MKRNVLYVLSILGIMVSLFFMENVLRHKPLTFFGSEKITILSLDPGTEVELSWVYAFNTDDSTMKDKLRDIGFGEIIFSDQWEKSNEGMKTSVPGETLLYKYPVISRAGYVFYFRVTGGEAVIEHVLPGKIETLTLNESESDMIPVCGLYNGSVRYRYPIYFLCCSLLLTGIPLYLCIKNKKSPYFPSVKKQRHFYAVSAAHSYRDCSCCCESWE